MSHLKDIKPKNVDIQLEGKVYKIRFDINALVELEDHYGDIDQAMGALDKGSFKAARTLLWAGFRRYHPEMSEADVGALMDLSNMKEISMKLGEALRAALPEASEGKGDSKNVKLPEVTVTKTGGTGDGSPTQRS